jgi:hypothetical protein
MSSILSSLIGFACLGIFLLAFGGGGIYLIIASRKTRAQAEASQNWPAAAGSVLRSEVGESTSTDSDGDTSTTYHPVVEYTYQVGGQSFTGRRITFGPVTGNSNPRKAQEVLSRYPSGGAVQVYYNPQKPDEAVLEKRASGTNVMLILGIVFLAITACLGLPGLVMAAVSLLGRLTGS